MIAYDSLLMIHLFSSERGVRREPSLLPKEYLGSSKDQGYLKPSLSPR